jgi:hypothetical protein
MDSTQFAWITVSLLITFLAGMLTMWLLLYPHRKLERYRELVRESEQRENNLRQVLQIRRK